MYHVEYLRQKEKQEELLSRKNEKSSFYNGIYLRWKNPVLTRDHVPLHWRYDLNSETNPFSWSVWVSMPYSMPEQSIWTASIVWWFG